MSLPSSSRYANQIRKISVGSFTTSWVALFTDRQTDKRRLQLYLPPLLAELTRRSQHSHKSAKTYAGNVFWTRDLDLWRQNKWVSRTHGGTFLCQVWWSQLHRFLRYRAEKQRGHKRHWKPYSGDWRRRGY